jgi:AraC-like DNA-binding protein
MPFRPVLSQSGRSVLGRPGGLARVNALLREALGRAYSIDAEAATFVWRHAHVGPGLYRRGQAAPLHRHAQFHLQFVLSGRFGFRTPRQPVPVGPGEALLVAPGAAHAWRAERDGFMLGGLVNVVGDAEAVAGALRRAPDGMVRVGTDEAARACGALMDACTAAAQPPWAAERVASHLNLVLMALMADGLRFGRLRASRPAAPPGPPDRRPGAAELCVRATEYLEANYGAELSVTDVARHVGLSPRHLSRLFSAHCGRGINATLVRLRLERARELLRARPDVPVKRIAYECGFARPAYFSACFRRAFGVRPIDVRR